MTEKKYLSLANLSSFLANIKTAFSPIFHTHNLKDVVDYTVDSSLSSASANPVRNSTLKSKFDELQAAINGKANASHTHAISEVSNLQASLDAKVTTSRTINGKSLTANISLTASDVGADPKGSASSALSSAKEYADTQIDALDYAASSHSHAISDVTNLQSELDTLESSIAGKAASGHIHTIANITNLQSSLDAKVPASRTVNGKALTTNITLSASDVGADAAGMAQTKSDAALASAKSYADGIKNDLLNGAGAAYDTLKELGDLINVNTDTIDALEVVAASKASSADLTSHISNKSNPHGVTLAQLGVSATAAELNIMDGVTATAAEINKLDGVTATTAELNYIDGVTSNIQAQLDSKAASSTLTSHTGNTTAHITSTERSNWNAAKAHADTAHAPSNAEANQNAFSNVVVGSTTISADTKTDTLTLVAGSNVTLTPNAANDSVTIASTNTTYSAATQSAAGLMSAADKTKLDGIATGANNYTYTLPSAGTSLGGVKSGGDVTISGGTITVNDDSHNHTVLTTKPDNFKQGNDLPSTYPRGETIFFSNNPANKFNNMQYCTVHTIKGYSNMVCIQYAYPYNTNADTIYYRMAIYNADVWRDWQTIVTSTTIADQSAKYATSAGSATTAATCTGNAATATKLASSPTISLTGDVSGSVSFNGSGNVSMTTTVADGSHNHSADNITSGTLPIERGGTGGANAATARTNLDVYSKAEVNLKFTLVDDGNGNLTFG